MATVSDPRLMVGTTTGDDAAVYRFDDRTAIVFTVDFFTPIVDDAYDWGRIAAANAMSDVYAMGGRPLLCLNIAAWPIEQLPASLLGDVVAGGSAVAAEAGALVAGGHTIDDREPKYGMAVVGIADPDRLITNDAARAGDRLFLTKPIGTGVITTALKRGEAGADVVEAAVESMARLNEAASAAAVEAGVRAGTDVTGFGLLGHLQRMCAASGVGATIRPERVPLLPGATEAVRSGAVPSGSRRNAEFLAEWVAFDGVAADTATLLTDAQTSGGLLLCAPETAAGDLARALSSRGVEFAEIGAIEQGEAGRIAVRPVSAS